MVLGHVVNECCRSYRDEEEVKMVLHLPGTCLALCMRRKWHLGSFLTAMHKYGQPKPLYWELWKEDFLWGITILFYYTIILKIVNNEEKTFS